jgi:hypothetical protein
MSKLPPLGLLGLTMTAATCSAESQLVGVEAKLFLGPEACLGEHGDLGKSE